MIKIRKWQGAFLLMLAVLGVLTTSCEKDFEWELPLAFNQKKLILKSSTGTTHIQVYSTKDWNVHFVDKVDWGSIDRTVGKENSEVVFSYAANYGVNREVKLAFETEKHVCDTVTLVQRGWISTSDARLIIGEKSVEAAPAAATLDLELDNNIKYDLYRVIPEVVYKSENPEENWIEEVTFDENQVHIKLAENATYEPRTAEVTLSIEIPSDSVDGDPKTVSTTTKITQLGKEVEKA